MKPTEVLLNKLFKTVLLAVCFCFFSLESTANTRFAYVTVKQTEHTTFPSVWNGDRYTAANYLHQDNLTSTGHDSDAYLEKGYVNEYHYMLKTHNFPSTYFELKTGESLKIKSFRAFNISSGAQTYTNGGFIGRFVAIEVSRPASTYKEYITASSGWVDGLATTTNPSSYKHFQPFYGPCTITFYFLPTNYREFASHRDGYQGRTVDLANYGSVIGFGGWEYTPSEMHVALEISGTPTDTSVGSTVGGGTSSSASGKNYVTVIPENSPTDVRIVLEQSTDLINWTSANQGVFSPSTSRRFFRVRAEEE